MATTGTRSISLGFTGDVTASQTVQAASNASSAGANEIKTLASGDNTITVPTGGTVPTAVTIIPPSGNTNLMKIKGSAGDTGVSLHKTDPSSIGLDSTVTSFIINASSSITGVRFIWT
jgi:hypothetical protein